MVTVFSAQLVLKTPAGPFACSSDSEKAKTTVMRCHILRSHTSLHAGQRWWAVALFLLFSASISRGQTTHNVTEPFLDDFVCNGNATVGTGTALAGDMTALETLRGWCAADSRCGELYAQDGAPNLETFIYLFQTTLTVPVASVYLETPLYNLMCAKTAEEFLAAGWVLLLINQMLDAGVCDVNERFVLNEAGTGGTCVCQPGKVCESDNSTLVIAIIILVAVVLALGIQFGVVLWNRTRMAAGPLSPSIESMVTGERMGTAGPHRHHHPGGGGSGNAVPLRPGGGGGGGGGNSARYRGGGQRT